jgi:hypothetical protein
MRGSGSAPPFSAPSVQVRGSGKKKKSSFMRNIIEFLFFMMWLMCTGIAGYFIGYDPTALECAQVQTAPQMVVPAAAVVRKACPESVEQVVVDAPTNLVREGGFTVEELKTMWECSHAEADESEVHKQILPDNESLKKTKWKSIITVEPKAFFKKYLTQYPADTRAVQPVVIFSHKPLKHFDELGEVCKVLDIAIVPDKPGVCVAVTETYHDVASYHMLHADRQEDGTFALTGKLYAVCCVLCAVCCVLCAVCCVLCAVGPQSVP